MEYEIHTTKKTLRRYRVHIIIGLLVLVIIGVIIAVSVHKPEGQNDQQDGQNNQQEEQSVVSPTPSPPEKSIPPEKPIPPKKQEQRNTTDITNYTVINTYIRQGKQYYTQGLLFKDPNTLLESSGLKGESAIHYLSFPNLTVLKESNLTEEYFGEGCEIVDNKGAQEIYQLTWLNRKIFVWDAKDLKKKRVLDLPQPIREGWGIAKRNETDNNGDQVTRLYITDGSSNLYKTDPFTMKVLNTTQVKLHNGVSVRNLNELEFIKGYLWANIYMSNKIAVINVDTGLVDYMIHLDGLDTLAKEKANEMDLDIGYDYVLNGIAYDSINDRLIVAGKKWPLMWQIQVDGIN